MSRGFFQQRPPQQVQPKNIARTSGNPIWQDRYRYTVCLTFNGNPIPPELGGVVRFTANSGSLTDAEILVRAWEGVGEGFPKIHEEEQDA